MKKRLNFILLICLCAALTACGGKTQGPPATEATVQTTAPTVPETTEAPEGHLITVPTEAPTVPETTVPPETEPETQPVEEPVHEVKALPSSLKDTDFVRVVDYVPNVVVELKYATKDNFTGRVLYDFEDVYLRVGTVRKLIAVEEDLRDFDLRLKIWDGFRPTSAQRKLWAHLPDENYVSHPDKGVRAHCRGNAVDLTLVDMNGEELKMPSGYDDTTGKADRDYSDCEEQVARNAQLLQDVMEKNGFHGGVSQWWFYVDNKNYSVDKVFTPINYSRWYAACESYINLRSSPSTNATSLAQIPTDEEFMVLGWYGDFALAQYEGVNGYVHRGYIGRVYD